MFFVKLIQGLRKAFLQESGHPPCNSKETMRSLTVFGIGVFLLGAFQALQAETHQRPREKGRVQARSSEGISKPKIPQEACSESDVTKYAGENALEKKFDLGSDLRLGAKPNGNLGMRPVTEDPAPYALFIQQEKLDKNPDYFSAVDDMGGHLDVPMHIHRFHNSLHPKIHENFQVLFSQALSCLEKDEAGFLLGLRKLVEASLYTDESHSAFSDFLGKVFNANTRKEEDYPEGYSGETQNVINRLLSRLKALEALADKDAKPVLGALNHYASNPPTRENLTALTEAIQRNPHQSSEVSKLVSQAVAGGRTTAFLEQQQRLTPPSEGSGFFGKMDSGTLPVSSAAVAHRVSQHLRSFDSAFEALKKSFNTGNGGLSPEESQIAWTRFQEALGPELKKLTPAQLVSVREALFSQLRSLDTTTPSASDPLDISLAREALLKAGYALERVIPDPAADLLPPEEQAERKSYASYVKNLQAFLQGRDEPRFQVADSAMRGAQVQFKMAVPLASASGIRKADPFLLGLIKTEKGAFHPQAKAFFESGFSTHLFNPVGSRKGATGLELSPVVARLAQSLETSGALKDFTTEEKKIFSDLLSAAGAPSATDYPSPFYNKPEEWQKAYQSLRDRLLGLLDANPSGPSVSEQQKALALAIETLDSTGNHTVNPYAPGYQSQFRDHYQMENILSRLDQEKKLLGESAADPATAIRDLVHGIQGIPARARVAQLSREATPTSQEENELLKLYRDLLLQQGKGKLSPEAEEALKKFAFDKQIPEQVWQQLSHLVPGFDALMRHRGLQEGFLPKDLVSEASGYSGAVKARDAAELRAIEAIRQAIRKTPGFLTNPETGTEGLLFLSDLEAQLESRPGLLASLLSESASGTESSLWFNSQLAPLLAQVPDLQKAVSGVQIAQAQLDARAERALGVGTEAGIPEVLPVLFDAGEAMTALGSLQARLGKDHPLVKRYQAEAAERFQPGGTSFDALVGGIASQERQKLNSDSAKRTALLERFKGSRHSPETGLQFDSGLGAFVFTDKTQLTTEMLAALEKELPHAKFVWRDSGSSRSYQEKPFSLHDLKQGVFDHDQALALAGFGPRSNEWFPIAGSSVLAGRWVDTENGKQFEFGNLSVLRERFNQKRKDTQKFQDAADRAVGNFEHFWHGAKAVVLNPFGLGYDPNESSENKELQRSREAFTRAREQLGEFGLIGPAGLLEGRNELQRFLDHETRLFHNTNQAAQRYVENAELAAEIEGAILTLPFALAGKAALTLSKIPQGSRAASLLVGTGRGLLHLNRAAQAGIGFAGLTAGTNAAFNAESLVLGDARKREIEADYERGARWRKHTEQPNSENYYQGGKFDEARYQKDWAAWQEEERWDRNGNGIPDFKEDHLKGVAFQGERTPFRLLVESPTHSYKSMYGIGLTGSLTPGLGMIPHVGLPHLLEQSLHYAAGAGKPGDFNNRLTLGDVARDTLVATGSLLPAMYAPGLATRFLPTRLQGPVPLGRIGIQNMQGLVGTGAATLAGVGTQAATTALYGGNPWEALDPANVFMNAYIGRGMAQMAALKSAQADILALRPDPARPGQLLLPGGKLSENPWEALVKKHGQPTVDMAIAQLQNRSVHNSERADIHGALAEYQNQRASQTRTQAGATLQGNPFRDSTPQAIQTRLSTLEVELSGTKGFRLAAQDPVAFAAKRAELKQARQALQLKAETLYFEESAQGFRSLQAFQQLRTDLVAQPRSQAEWRRIISEAPSETRPFLEELQQIARETPSRNSPWWQQAQELARQDSFVGDLAGSIINPHHSSSTPQTRAERATALLGQVPLETLPSAARGSAVDYRGEIVRQYVLSRTSDPKVAERLFAQLGAPAGTAPEVLAQVHQQFGQGLAVRFQRYIELPGRDRNQTLDQHFYEFLKAEPTLSLPGSPLRLGAPR